MVKNGSFSLMSHVSQLQKSMGYFFQKDCLLKTALTHPSYCTDNNQRMEYLGDSLLNFIVSQLLYRKHSSLNEGVLTRLRAHLVCRNTLAKVARNMKIDRVMNVGKSFDQKDFSDGMFADAFEAVLAAIYLDGGYESAEKVCLFCYENFLSKNYADVVQKDPKTTLQEFCQKNQYPLPVYTVSENGDKDKSRFFVKAQVSPLNIQSTAFARTKREGQRLAAEHIIFQLEQKGML